MRSPRYSDHAPLAPVQLGWVVVVVCIYIYVEDYHRDGWRPHSYTPLGAELSVDEQNTGSSAAQVGSVLQS